MNAPCCIIYSTILFDLDMTGRHLKLKTPNTLSLGHRVAEKTKCCKLIMSQKKKKRKKLISFSGLEKINIRD